MKVNLVSLGCARNLVDSEVMLGCLTNHGWAITEDPSDADVIIVNTCGFISSAVDESIDTILELAEFKRKGACRRLVVAGCLPERFREELAQSLPEVDLFLGTGAYERIVPAVEESLKMDSQPCLLPKPYKAPLHRSDTPRVVTSSHMAYLKIAEGCSRHCTYCMIPKLRGRQRSRPLNDIVMEGRSFARLGIRELVLVAQDSTAYGKDLEPAVGLNRLLENMADISDDIWVRFLYGHPESVDKKLVRTVAARQNICPYFDIPIQHASDRVLKKMGRHYTRDALRKLFDTIRSTVPGAVLRTTVIVGFPGETDKDFNCLLDFAQEIGFDHLGVFTYSDAEELPSHRLPDPVDEKTAAMRYDRLMACQADISFAKNQTYIGKTLRVLVEEGPEDNYYKGRTVFQAPEVDGITYIASNDLQIGSFVDVKIISATDYDVTGKRV